MNNTFGERLKKLRKEKKLTQVQLSNEINVNQGTYSRWEKGVLEPNLENIIKLSKILDITTDELLGRNVNFGDKITFNIAKYDLSDLRNFSEQEHYDLKASLVMEFLDETMDIQEIKSKLISKNRLDKDEEVILDTILIEAKEFADQIIEFEKFKKSQKRKFRWPWQKQ